MMNWFRKKSLFALDLGTSKFCLAAVRRVNSDESPQLDLISVKAQGMNKGMVANFDEAKRALNALIEKAEKQLNCDIDQVIVGIAGSHLQGKQVKTSFPLHQNRVTHQVLELLTNHAKMQSIDEGYEILHTVPIDFQIDNREKIDSPIGFSGHLIKASYLQIYADQSYVKDVVRLCNESGLQVRNFYAEPFASSCVGVSDRSKELGCVVADIGGGTTDGIVFQDSRPVSLFTVNIGGFMMTKDLAIGLNLLDAEAERVKHHFGLRPPESCPSLEVTNADEEKQLVQWRDVFQVLGPRISELSQAIGKEIVQYKGLLPGGVLLTGGGANVRGIQDYINDQLKVPVALSLPQLDVNTFMASKDKHKRESYKKPHSSKFATALGLLSLEIAHLNESPGKGYSVWPTRTLSQFIGWIKELS